MKTMSVMCRSPLAILFSLGAICALTTGCKTREIAATESSEKTLVFSDDFERDALGGSWRRGKGEEGAGKWRIEDGWLAADNIKNDPLWWTGNLPEDVRVEFDAKAMSDTGDIKFEIFGDGLTHESGYIVIFGGWDNSLDVIARLDEHGQDRKARPSAKAAKGQVHHIALERTDGTLRWFVDGDLHMTYEDDAPLKGRGHRGFAFNDWTAPVRFDNLKVWRL